MDMETQKGAPRVKSGRRGTTVLAVLVAAALLQAAFASGAAADDRVYYDGNGYLLVETLFESWDDANAIATSMPRRGCASVHLATITSAGEQAVVGGLMAGVTENAWLGGFQPPGELSRANGWQWVTGEPWFFTNWAGGEPNDTPYGTYIPGSEQYLEIYQGSGAWNDAPSPDPGLAKYFVVEYEDCPTALAVPQAVEIVVDETIPVVIPGGGGPFVATGPSVDRGVLCPEGTTLNTALASRPDRLFTRLWIEKVFTCDDSSGDFVVQLRVKLFPDGTTTARWEITGGTGAYATLQGSGGLVGTPTIPGVSIEDVYTGKVKR